MTQEFNSLLVAKEVELTEYKQKLKVKEDEADDMTREIKSNMENQKRLEYAKKNLVSFARYILEKMNDTIKVHIFEMLDQIEAQLELDDTFRCIIECIEDCKVGFKS